MSTKLPARLATKKIDNNNGHDEVPRLIKLQNAFELRNLGYRRPLMCAKAKAAYIRRWSSNCSARYAESVAVLSLSILERSSSSLGEGRGRSLVTMCPVVGGDNCKMK